MAANIEMIDGSTTNPCCSVWEGKYLKLQQKVKKTENGRAALKKAVGIYEQQFDKMQNESLKLKKAYEEEKLQADHERKEKERESAARVSMENEISTLKAKILSLSKKQSSISENVSEELIHLKQHVSDKEKQLNCLQEEKKRAMVDKSRTEQELSNLKTQLINVETEKKRLMQDLQKEKKRADEMLETAKIEKNNESAARVSMENEVSTLKAKILSSSEKQSSISENVSEELIHLKQHVADKEKKLNCLQEEKKKAIVDKSRTEQELSNLKTQLVNVETENKRLMQDLKKEKKRADEMLETAKIEKNNNEPAARVSMENEISTLKAKILSLSQKQGSISENVSEELIHLKQVADKEKQLNCLQEEKKRAMVDKSRTEQELSNLKTQLINVETEKKRLMQDLQKEKKRADEMLETAKIEKINNILETEIGRLKELVEIERKRADCEAKKAETEKKNKNELETEIGRLKELVETERKRADCEAKKAETEKKNNNDLETEIGRFKELVETERKRADCEAKKAKTKKKNDNDLETEIGRLKELVETERKRADCESKKAETEKKTANKVKEVLKAEQSKADEQRKLVDVERKKYEEFAHQLQKSKCEADEAKSKLVSEGLKFKEANKKFEAEKKRSIKEKRKAEEQQKIAEMSTKHALEEKHNAVRLQQQLEDCQNKYDNLKKDMENYKTNLKTNLDVDKETENKKAAEMYKLQAMKEKTCADKLAKQLEDTKKQLHNEHNMTRDLVSFKNPTETVNVNSAEMKLLKKRLKFEKERVKHYNQVAKLEKKCKQTVEEELNRLKLEFARFSSRVGLCNCFDLNNVGKSCLEKNKNVSLKRQCLQAGSGKELAKFAKPSEYLKPNLDVFAPSLPVSGTCTESTAGTASKMELMHNRKKLDSFALISSMSSFSDRQLPLPISRLSSENAEVADNNAKSPLKVKSKDENTKKRKQFLNATESIEQLTRLAKIAKSNDKSLAIDNYKEKTVENEELENFKKMFDGDCMKLLNFDSEVDEERYRAAVGRPLSPTLPNIEFKSSLIVLENSRPSESEIPVITTESWSIVVFSEFRNTKSLSKIFHVTKTFKRQCCTFSQSDLVVKNVISTLSADKILSPREKVCVFFSMILKSFSSDTLTKFDRANDENFLSSIHTVSGQLKKVMSDVETRIRFLKVCDFEEFITLIQNFLINGEILVCNTETSTETSSLPGSKASFHEFVIGAVFLASVCETLDRVDFLCETSFTISHVTSSLTLTLLHVFGYVCGEKMLTHGDYNLIMTVVKSLVIHQERANLSFGFSSCDKCPFSIGTVSMEELASLLLKKFNDRSIHVSDLGDVLSLLELLATNMSWIWVCKNIVSELLKMLETCVLETHLTSIFVLLSQLTRLGIDPNGLQDAEVEGIRVKLISFISESASNKISLPVQFAAVTALLGTTRLGFQDICKNSNELLPPVSSSTASATDCIQRWFSLLSDECKSLWVKTLNC